MTKKYLEASARLFYRVFVCRKCKTKLKANARDLASGKISCKRCQGRHFRPIKSKK
ncbi:MAG TPA: hypothetical protein VJC07_02190 [Candidatus Nanoarchaeia archaeon]|nr:hypothetical protein [Candidatus Nanoarchaeia archaeon]